MIEALACYKTPFSETTKGFVYDAQLLTLNDCKLLGGKKFHVLKKSNNKLIFISPTWGNVHVDDLILTEYEK